MTDRYPGAGRLLVVSTAGILSGTLFAIAPAWAHGDIGPGENPLLAIPFSPEIFVGLILAAFIYAVGLKRMTPQQRRARLWRHIAFFGGLVALGIALQSPIEPIADHLFVVHQVEHMLLRTVGPLLLMLSLPQPVLMRGLPGWARRGIAQPLVTSGVIRAIFGVLSQPFVATLLFVGVSSFWMLPKYHDIAILDEPIHYLWHVSLLVTGLIFFWRVFDARQPPAGPSVPARLFMLWFAAIGNILLGAFLSFKTAVLYSAYIQMGRFWGLDALSDERFGGLTMWIPGGMMLALAAIAVVWQRKRQEERNEVVRLRMGDEAPLLADDFVAARRSGNRTMALGMVFFVSLVFVLAFTVVIIVENGAVQLHS